MTRLLYAGLLALLLSLSASLSPTLNAASFNDPLAAPWHRELLIELQLKSPYNFYAFHKLRAGAPVNCSWLMYRTRRRAGDIVVRPAMSRQMAHGMKGWYGRSHARITGGALGFYTLPPWTRPLGHVIYYEDPKTIIHASSGKGRVVKVPVTKYWSDPAVVRTPTTGRQK